MKHVVPRSITASLLIAPRSQRLQQLLSGARAIASTAHVRAKKNSVHRLPQTNLTMEAATKVHKTMPQTIELPGAPFMETEFARVFDEYLAERKAKLLKGEVKPISSWRGLAAISEELDERIRKVVAKRVVAMAKEESAARRKQRADAAAAEVTRVAGANDQNTMDAGASMGKEREEEEEEEEEEITEEDVLEHIDRETSNMRIIQQQILRFFPDPHLQEEMMATPAPVEMNAAYRRQLLTRTGTLEHKRMRKENLSVVQRELLESATEMSALGRTQASSALPSSSAAAAASSVDATRLLDAPDAQREQDNEDDEEEPEFYPYPDSDDDYADGVDPLTPEELAYVKTQKVDTSDWVMEMESDSEGDWDNEPETVVPEGADEEFDLKMMAEVARMQGIQINPDKFEAMNLVSRSLRDEMLREVDLADERLRLGQKK